MYQYQEPTPFSQRVDEALAIRIIHEDPFAPVTAIHDVINRASLLDSQLAGRDGRVALAALCINIKNRPYFRPPAYSTLNFRAMAGEWLWAVYVSISRTDPISRRPHFPFLSIS